MGRLSRENPTEIFWEPERLSDEGETWRLGIGADTSENTLVLMPPPIFFASYLGGDAPSRLAASEVTLALATFNPTLLQTDGDGVSFGMLLAPADSETPLLDGVGLNIDVVQPGVVNIGIREGDDVDVISQRALNAVIVRFRLERTGDGRVQTYFNGEPLGIVGGNTETGAPLAPVLYVTDGGVIVNVTEWRVLIR